MKKLAFRFSLIFGVIASLMFLLPSVLNTEVYAAGAQINYSSWLYSQEDNKSYKSNVNAGVVKGYGKYVIGDEAVLTAQASDEFNFVGWEIIKGQVEEDVNGTIYSESFSNEEFGNCQITLGNINLISINQVLSDLTIRAVFDYKYSDVTISSDIVDNLKLSTDVLTINGSSIEVKYTTKNETADEVKYSNAIVDSKAYGELFYNKTNLLYTKHTKKLADGSESLEKIEYINGSYRKTEKAEFSFKIDTSDNFVDGKNIDVQSIISNGDKLYPFEEGKSNYYKITKDEYQRTSEIEINTSIKNDITLSWQKHNLYVVNYKFYLDIDLEDAEPAVELTDNTEIAYIAGQIWTTNVYHKISDTNSTLFLVKNWDDNNKNPSLTIECEEKVYVQIDGINYAYYQFARINGYPTQKTTFSDITSNTTIEFTYQPATYKVQFQFTLLENNTLTPKLDAELNKEELVLLCRGDDYTLDSTSLQTYFGYDFKGFTLNLPESGTNYTETTIAQIDSQKPQDVVVYVIYEKTSYSLQLVDETEGKFLVDSNMVTTYPVGNIIGGGANLTTSPTGFEITFDGSYKLGDSFTISLTSNPGFKVALNFGDVENSYAKSLSLSQTIDEEFVKTYCGASDEIKVYLFAEYETFNVVYKIEPRYSGENKILMADIAISSSITDDERIGEIQTDATGAKSITIYNVKLYEKITLKATAAVYNADDPDNIIYYNFQGISDGNTLFGTPSKQQNIIYDYVLSELSSKTLTALFSAPEVNLTIMGDNDIYSLENVKVYNDTDNDGILDEVTGENNVYKVSGSIKVELNNLNSIKDHYYFSGAKLKTETSEIALPKAEMVGIIYTININANVPHIFEIVCPQVIYSLSIQQYGFGFDGAEGNQPEGSLVTFNGNSTSKELTLSNNVLEFDLPLAGIYVSETNINGFTQAYNSSQKYKKELTEEDFKLLDPKGIGKSNGKVNAVLEFTYSIITFDITIKLEQNTAKTNRYEDLTKQVQIAIDGFDFSVEVNKYIFRGIPYGTKNLIVTANITNGYGLVHSAWTQLNGAKIVEGEDNKVKFDNIIEGKTLTYSVNYFVFKVNVDFEGKGNPKININGQESLNILALDSLEIQTNAKKLEGYKFLAMYREVPQEQYDILNSNEKLKVGNDYYVLVEMDPTNPLIFVDESVELSEYYIKDEKLNFYIVYDLISVNVEYSSSLYVDPFDSRKDSPTLIKEKGDINIDVSEFANFSLKQGATIFASDAKLDYTTGKVVFCAQMRYAVYDEKTGKYIASNDQNEQGTGFNLIQGVELREISCNIPEGTLFWNIVNINESDNTFEIEIDFSSIIPYLEDSTETITINSIFNVKRFMYSFTTNIDTDKTDENYSSFYQDSNNFRLKVSAINGFTGYDGVSGATLYEEEDGILYDEQQFLYARSLSFTLGGDYARYFEINTFKVYYKNELVEPERYNSLGVNYNPETGLDVTIRFVSNDVQISFVVEPKIVLTGATDGVFVKTLQYNASTNNSISQSLTIGTTIESEISMAQELYDFLILDKVRYVSEDDGGITINGAADAGLYTVELEFAEGDGFAFEGLVIVQKIEMRINPLQLKLTSSVEDIIEKTYDRTSDIEFNKIKKYLQLTTDVYIKQGNDTELVKDYVINLDETANFGITKSNLYICDREGRNVINASNEVHSVKIELVKLTCSTNLNNFILTGLDNAGSYVIKNCVRINKKNLKISNIILCDKVYDGTTEVFISNMQDVVLEGVIGTDIVEINFAKLNFSFANAEVGLNKEVNILNIANCLEGDHKFNYNIQLTDIEYNNPSIYPYSITADVGKYGQITLVNERGKVPGSSYVNLIPIGAKLDVKIIERNDVNYRDIYRFIEGHISGNREFAVGYQISLIVNGNQTSVPNLLYLRLPIEGKMKDVVSLSNEQTLVLKRTDETKNDTFLIDLSQINSDVDIIFISRFKVLFEVWQIILIIGAFVLVIGTVVTITLIKRKQKLKKYSVNEKI